MERFIVAEASKTWAPNVPATDLLSNKFELIINVNSERGYTLREWKLFSAISGDNQFTETIIAIFEKNDTHV